MTQLEQELKQALKLQKEMFKSELEEVTQQYLKDLNQIVDMQSKELRLYDSHIQQIQNLTKQVEDLTRKLANLN